MTSTTPNFDNGPMPDISASRESQSRPSHTTPTNTTAAASVAINVVRGGVGAALGGNDVDEGWHAARSSGNALLPSTAGAPTRKKHVLVEHTNGIFVPQTAHEQIRIAEERRKMGLMMSNEGKAVGNAGWGEREDAKNFILHVIAIKKLVARTVRLLGAFSFGFCAFEFINTYSDSMNNDSSIFLPMYSRIYFVEQKLMTVLTMCLVTFFAFPVAFEFGTARQSTDQNVAKTLARNQQAKNQRRQDVSASATHHVVGIGNANVSGSLQLGFKSPETNESDKDTQQRNKFMNMLDGQTAWSPFRHLFGAQFLGYLLALATTLVITSVDEGRNSSQIENISHSLLQRIQICQIVRVAALALSAIASLRHEI